jgi:hypothetical protein
MSASERLRGAGPCRRCDIRVSQNDRCHHLEHATTQFFATQTALPRVSWGAVFVRELPSLIVYLVLSVLGQPSAQHSVSTVAARPDARVRLWIRRLGDGHNGRCGLHRLVSRWSMCACSGTVAWRARMGRHDSFRSARHGFPPGRCRQRCGSVAPGATVGAAQSRAPAGNPVVAGVKNWYRASSLPQPRWLRVRKPSRTHARLRTQCVA